MNGKIQQEILEFEMRQQNLRIGRIWNNMEKRKASAIILGTFNS